MINFYAFSAKYCLVIGAIEVLNSLFMFFTKQAIDTFFVFKIDVSKNGVSIDNLIKNIEIQRELVNILHFLDKLSADWTLNPLPVVQLGEAFSAESVSTMDHNPWYFLSNIEIFPAIIAKI